MKRQASKPRRRSSLRFHVGPFVYKVRIPAEPIPNPNNADKPLLALAVLVSRELLISPHAKPQSRAEYLLHELRHAWLFHVPKPRTAEEDADLSAMMMASLLADLAEQGGMAALERLRRARPSSAQLDPIEDRLAELAPVVIAAKPMMRIAQGA
jgi:hypothetical protein